MCIHFTLKRPYQIVLFMRCRITVIWINELSKGIYEVRSVRLLINWAHHLVSLFFMTAIVYLFLFMRTQGTLRFVSFFFNLFLNRELFQPTPTIYPVG